MESILIAQTTPRISPTRLAGPLRAMALARQPIPSNSHNSSTRWFGIRRPTTTDLSGLVMAANLSSGVMATRLAMERMATTSLDGRIRPCNRPWTPIASPVPAPRSRSSLSLRGTPAQRLALLTRRSTDVSALFFCLFALTIQGSTSCRATIR